jgi:hypothetical protein
MVYLRQSTLLHRHVRWSPVDNGAGPVNVEYLDGYWTETQTESARVTLVIRPLRPLLFRSSSVFRPLVSVNVRCSSVSVQLHGRLAANKNA